MQQNLKLFKILLNNCFTDTYTNTYQTLVVNYLYKFDSNYVLFIPILCLIFGSEWNKIQKMTISGLLLKKTCPESLCFLVLLQT
jgi:hypothetical protein